MCVYDAHKCAQIVNIRLHIDGSSKFYVTYLPRQSRENRKINHLFQQNELIHRNVFTNAVKQYKAQL